MLPAITDEQRKTIRWEKVSRGFWHKFCGVKSVGYCRVRPAKKDDTRKAVVGYNDMIRNDFVYYTKPHLPHEPENEPILCEIIGVSRRGTFDLQILDPSDPSQNTVRTTVVNCRPAADFSLGKRII